MGRSPVVLVIEDVCSIGSSFNSFFLSQVKRGGNTVAHVIARLQPVN